MKQILAIICLVMCGQLSAQRIFYARSERSDLKSMNVEVIGKFNRQYLIYKEAKNVHRISVYDASMELKDETLLDFIPDRVSSVECFGLRNGVFIVYQYQKRNISYCMAARLDAAAKLTGEPIVVDTTVLSLVNNEGKIYSFVMSDDRQKIVAFKMKNDYRDELDVKMILMNDSLRILKKSVFTYPVKSNQETIGNFAVDNDGHFLFTHVQQSVQRDQPNLLQVCTLLSGTDSLQKNVISIGRANPDEVKMKLDQVNARCVLTSFYANSRRGNMDGLLYIDFDYIHASVRTQKLYEFSDELKSLAKGENSLQGAFNDYYLQDFYIRKDGGFILFAESNYTNNRGNGFNRWDNPYNWGGGWGRGSGMYWGMSPFNNFGWGMPGSMGNFGSMTTRYFSDNITIFSFNKEGELIWNNVLPKIQFDDNTDDLLSYRLLNNGKEIFILYNEWTRRAPALAVQTMTAEGKFSRQQPLRNMDKGYEFLIRKARQVGLRELIVPVSYRNTISFARISF
jgi:hypothetical protein